MAASVDLLRRAAPTLAPVLLHGETGTGKELLARGLHEEGPRAQGPFVAVNAAALPEAFLESELFGHEVGAFSGADRARSGIFREVHGGTLFLDEVQEMPPDLQAKLLRVLQERTVRPVGGGHDVAVDVRVVTATSEDPVDLVRAGLLRDDLYYRLAVLVVRVPPLRERREDVPLLVHHFLAREGGRTIEPPALALLAGHSWPGNVRELENVVRELAVLAGGRPIGRELVTQRLARDASLRGEPSPATLAPSLAEAKEQFERQLVAAALARNAGNIAATARELRVDRSQFHRVLERLHLNPAMFRSGAPPHAPPA